MSVRSLRFDASTKAKYFLPKYWISWFLIALLYVFAYMPIKTRDRFARFLGMRLYHTKLLAKRKKIAFTNLSLCFPEYTESQKEALMQENLVVAAQIALSLGEIVFRSRTFLVKRINFIGEHYIKEVESQGKAAIFLSSHSFSIDFLASAALGARGYSLCGIFKDYNNPIFDWFTLKSRTRFLTEKGMLSHRNEGLKPIVKNLRNKIHLFYLPDEDHGREKSIFVPFFATQKATLPLTGRLAKLGRACVLPIYSAYNEKTSKIDVICYAPLQNFPTKNEVHDTQKINEALEKLINENRSQYMWTLKLFKTRPDENTTIY